MKLHNYLDLFNHIVTRGDKTDDKYFYNQFCAWYDLDGYTCYVGFKDLTLSLYFHNRSSFDFKDETTLSEFNHNAELILSQR